MKIHKDGTNGKLWLSQQEYVEKILKKFGMNNVKPVKSFWLSIISFLQVYVQVMKKKMVICLVYHMLVGSMYAMK